MFKKFGLIYKLALTILIGMVFVVNVGFTFAANLDYELTVESKTPATLNDGSYNYLNDIVVNNSTTLVPIPYTNGTVNREISFDYGFSEPMDIAIVYSMSYTDGTAVNNVRLNIVDRDNYIQDVPTVNSLNSVTQYNGLSATGTLYYTSMLEGSGNQKIFSGVTFYEGNSQVESYVTETAVRLYSSTYTANQTITASQYENTKQDIARYWKVSAYSNGNQTLTEEEYNKLPASEQASYSVSQYSCVQAYTANGSSVSAGATASTSQYANHLAVADSRWTVRYSCVTAGNFGGTSYSVGDLIESAQYTSLTSEEQKNFQKCYLCLSNYSVVGANSYVVSASGTITPEVYKTLNATELDYFVPASYKSFDNKKLTLDVKVYAKLNASATGDSATTYYTTEHYFSNYTQHENSMAFTYWLNLKKTTNASGETTVPANTIMVYNAHGNFESGLTYKYDFPYSTDIREISSRSNITTSYLYSTDGKFYTYAGGNKFDANLGVYYMAQTAGSIKFSVGVNWFSANGELLSSMPVGNVEIGNSDNFSDIGDNFYGYSHSINANSCGYIDLLDYIQMITKNSIYNYVGCRLVITTINVQFVSSANVTWSTAGTKSDVTVINSTQTNPVLYKYSSMGASSWLDANVSIFNDSENAIVINSVTVSPKFYAYNGQTGSGYALANTKELSFGDAGSSGTRFNYESTSWTKSGSSSAYTFESNGIYLAPNTSVNLIDGVYIAAQTVADWLVTINGTDYYADYWFELEISGISYGVAQTNKTSTKSAELISELTTATISSGNVSYIAIRNNTSQIMTNVSFTGKILNTVNNSYNVAYSLLNYATNATSNNTQASSISITFTGVNLRPGESIILAKITVTSGSNIGLASGYACSCTLGSTPSTAVYAKRDFASGNLSIVNPTATITTLSLTMKNFAGNVTLSDVNLLNGSTNKWSYSSNFKYIEKNTNNSAYIHTNQLLNVLTDYYLHDITTTIAQ